MVSAHAAVDARVDTLMLALEAEYAGRALTPGGVSWLHVHQVPIRRLVRRVVMRLLAPGPLQLDRTPGQEQGLVVARRSVASGYVSYDASEVGLAYLLGLRDDEPVRAPVARRPSAPEPPVPGLLSAPVCAVSWSSRHADTLLPVLGALANRGVASVVIDLATEAEQRFPKPGRLEVAMIRPPAWLLTGHGGLPAGALPSARAARPARRAAIGRHRIWLPRLARLASGTVVRTTDSTQPSWSAAVRVETWLDDVLAQVDPGVLLCCNDTSPLGLLTIRAAERDGADTVYVQHGAWVTGDIPWRVQHCRHIAVMGARDVQASRSWVRRADARLHVTGQPRFDALARADPRRQRAYLERLLTQQAGASPHRIAVWACQPFSEQRLLGQLHTILDGVRHTSRRWGLVIAPHPAQRSFAIPDLLDATDGVSVALADPGVGARGCLAGADALLSTSSTCGIEALLSGTPVLELSLPRTRTLGLAEHGAAQRCTSAEEITIALARADKLPATVRVPAAAKAAICRWDGRGAVAVADIVTDALAERTPTAPSPRRTRTTPQP